MAIQYVDTDAVSTGTGTELSPYNATQAASLDLAPSDIIYFKGTTDITIQTTGSTTTMDVFFMNWPGSTPRETRIILEATSANAFRTLNLTCVGVHIAIQNNSTSTNAPIRSGSQAYLYDGKLSCIDGTGVNSFQASSSEWIVIDNSEVDMTNISTWVRSGGNIAGLILSNSTVHSYTSLSQPAFMLNGTEVALINNKFYNIDTPEGIIELDQIDESPKMDHNTFWITDTNTPVLNLSQLTDNFKPLFFYGNVVAYQSQQLFDSGLSAANVGFSGGNLFYNAQFQNYTPRAGLTDQTDTGSHPFASTTSTDSNFLELRSTSNGKNADPLNSNRDIGAVQGAGLVVFPDTGDVKAGVQYGTGLSGDRTGTRTDAPVNDVRDGVLYGDPDAQLEGTLVAYNDDDVIESAGGNYKTVTEAQVEAGVEFGPASSRLTGQATILEDFPTHLSVTVYTSDGSAISGTHTETSKVFSVAVGTNGDTFLSSIGVSERFANSDAVEERDPQNQDFIRVRLVR